MGIVATIAVGKFSPELMVHPLTLRVEIGVTALHGHVLHSAEIIVRDICIRLSVGEVRQFLLTTVIPSGKTYGIAVVRRIGNGRRNLIIKQINA